MVDLDVIDATNLNRQFLFQRRHVGQSKAHVSCSSVPVYWSGIGIEDIHLYRSHQHILFQVAKEAVLAFNPNAKVISHLGNIKDTETFDADFFASFDLVMNALDNLGTCASFIQRLMG